MFCKWTCISVEKKSIIIIILFNLNLQNTGQPAVRHALASENNNYNGNF
jgi:hypothetical protein